MSTKTKAEIKDACEDFLRDWNRTDWMVDHGEYEGDDIAAGLIDPDSVAGLAESCDVWDSWQAWDCTESWGAYRYGNDLYLRWGRNPYPHSARIERDLWVLVESDFFDD